MKKILFLSFLAMLITFAAKAQTQTRHVYVDENTEKHSHLATQIEADASDKVNITSLSGGWYYVEYMNATLENELTIYGDVVLILGDHGKLTITNGINIPAGSSLTIYDGTYYAAGAFQGGELYIKNKNITVDGALIINSASVFKVDNVLIAGSGSVSINNGSVDIFAIWDPDEDDGVRMSDVSILGGRVKVNYLAADKLTLGYKTEDDQINITDDCDVESASIAKGCVYMLDGSLTEGELDDDQINLGVLGEQLEQPAVPLPDGFTNIDDLKASITLKPDLTYTTEPQLLAEYEPLSSDYVSKYGKLVFSVAVENSNGDWADEPKATAMGTYTVSYMIESTNPKFKDSESVTLDGNVSIVAKDGVTFTDNTIKYYIYDETNKYVEVIGWEDENYNAGSDIEIQIPATVSKDDVVYKVRKIGANAFSYLKGRYEYGYLKTVVFAENNNIISIGANAFNSNYLASINLGACKKLTTIGHGAFGYCYQLESVDIPDGVTELADGLFATSTNLKSVSFSKVTKIGTGVFKETSLESVDLAGVKEIGSMAFNQSKITSLTIPASVKSIGGEAFASCPYLESITFAEGGALTTIEGSTFNGVGVASGVLLDITVPSNITTIGDNAFANAALKKITFEKGVTTFGNGVFAYISILNVVDDLEIVIKADNPILGDAPFGEEPYGTYAKEKHFSVHFTSYCADRDAINEAWGSYFEAQDITGGFTLDEGILSADLFTKEYDGDNEILFESSEPIIGTGYSIALHSATLWDANNMPSPTVGKDKTVKINYDITVSDENTACSRTGATTQLSNSITGTITTTKGVTIYPNSTKNITIEGVTSNPGAFTEESNSNTVSAIYQSQNIFNVTATATTAIGEYTLTSADGTVTIKATVPAPPLQASYTVNGEPQTVSFYNLEEAFEYTGYPDGVEITITQVGDYDEVIASTDRTIDITKKFTIELSNGKNFDISYLDRSAAPGHGDCILKFSINENASLTINAPSTAKFENVRFSVKGTLTINGGDYTDEYDCVIVVNDNGVVNITDGNFVSKSDQGCILVHSKAANISGGYFESYDGFPLYVGSSAEVKLSGGTFKYSGSQSEFSAILNGHTQPHSILEDGYQMYDNTGEPIDEVYSNGARGLIIEETDAVVTEVSVEPKQYSIALPGADWEATIGTSSTEVTSATKGTIVTLTYTGSEKIKKVEVFPILQSFSITSSSTMPLHVNGTTTLSCDNFSPEGVADEDKVVTWRSANETVASVAPDTGVVTAKAVGEATITAETADGKTATITITVVE